MLKKIKGTQDFLDLNLFNFFISKAKNHLKLYNFKEIATPIIEPTELFKRSLGIETDVVSKEMFLIKSPINDDNNVKDESICLRPEATASTVRAFINNNIELTPWKVFSYGPMFRYERPQLGRYRQFHQFNIEVIGSNSIYQDAQFIKMLERFFQDDLCLDNYALLINFLGCKEDRRLYKEKLRGFLKENKDNLCSKCLIRQDKNILRVLDCKNINCQELYKSTPELANNLCMTCSQEWQVLQNELEHLSVSYTYDSRLVRGLDYYEKTVFEFVSNDLGSQSTFSGGGRYNQLAKELGAKEDQPSIGAAIGIERILILLDLIKNKLDLLEQEPLYLIIPLENQQVTLAMLFADELQANCIKTDILFPESSIKSRMRKANKMGANFVLLIGEEEQKNKQIIIKNMQTGESKVINQLDLVNTKIKPNK